MKIKAVLSIPLYGSYASDEWMARLYENEENVHTLIEIITDEGVTGLGRCFTSLRSRHISCCRPRLISL